MLFHLHCWFWCLFFPSTIQHGLSSGNGSCRICPVECFHWEQSKLTFASIKTLLVCVAVIKTHEDTKKISKTESFNHLLDKIKLPLRANCKKITHLSESTHLCVRTSLHEVHQGLCGLELKRLKEGDINGEAAGEWKAEIQRRCVREWKIIGSCGFCLRLRYCMLLQLDVVG